MPAHVPSERSTHVHKIVYRDGTTETYDSEEHIKTFQIGDATITVEEDKIELEVGDASVTIEDDKIKHKIGLNDIEITDSEVKGRSTLTRFKFTATKADIRVGVGWMVLTHHCDRKP